MCSLIASFSLCQGQNISGKDLRVHCSLNINTETGRLSARRPNLQVILIFNIYQRSLMILVRKFHFNSSCELEIFKYYTLRFDHLA